MQHHEKNYILTCSRVVLIEFLSDVMVVSGVTKENMKEEVKRVYFKERFIQDHVITLPPNHKSFFIFVLITSFKNGAC